MTKKKNKEEIRDLSIVDEVVNIEGEEVLTKFKVGVFNGKRNQLVIRSTEIAEALSYTDNEGKYHKVRHSDVLRAIERLDIGRYLTEHIPALSEYKDKSGKINKEYLLDETAFAFFIGKYNNERANYAHAAYVLKFDEMRDFIREVEDGVLANETAKESRKKFQAMIDSILHGYYYGGHHTNNIYKSLYGKNAKEIRAEYNLGGYANVRQSLNNEGKNIVVKYEKFATTLMEMGYEYDEIKEEIEKRVRKDIPEHIDVKEHLKKYKKGRELSERELLEIKEFEDKIINYRED